MRRIGDLDAGDRRRGRRSGRRRATSRCVSTTSPFDEATVGPGRASPGRRAPGRRRGRSRSTRRPRRPGPRVDAVGHRQPARVRLLLAGPRVDAQQAGLRRIAARRRRRVAVADQQRAVREERRARPAPRIPDTSTRGSELRRSIRSSSPASASVKNRWPRSSPITDSSCPRPLTSTRWPGTRGQSSSAAAADGSTSAAPSSARTRPAAAGAARQHRLSPRRAPRSRPRTSRRSACA